MPCKPMDYYIEKEIQSEAKRRPVCPECGKKQLYQIFGGHGLYLRCHSCKREYMVVGFSEKANIKQVIPSEALVQVWPRDEIMAEKPSETTGTL